MGVPDWDREGDHRYIPTDLISRSRPSHEESVGSFYIGKYEVTSREFCKFLNSDEVPPDQKQASFGGDGESTITKVGAFYTPRLGYDLAPAVSVTWFGAKWYCEWLTRTTGVLHRLPTEIEWEYAARGPESRTWPWGNTYMAGAAFLASDQIPYWRRFGGQPLVGTVGQFPLGATPSGVCDMIGNASEWCANGLYPYSSESVASSTARLGAMKSEFEPDINHPPVVRGAQYVDYGRTSTAWARNTCGASGVARLEAKGFRVLREALPEKCDELPPPSK